MPSLANRRTASIESLSVPRRQKVFDTTLVPAGDPLPVWTTLPLDSKLPVVPSPRGSYTLWTTKVGEPKYINKQRYDFDLNDPNAYARPGEYDSLHDPFLKSYFENPRTRRHLVHNDLITRDGRVKCDVKEFNQFREYIRYRSVTDLSLQRNREREEFEDSWLGHRAVKSEDTRHKYASKESLNVSKASDKDRDRESTSTDRHALYGRNVSLVQRLRTREETLMRKLAEKERHREEEHNRRVREEWEDRKRRQQRLLQMEEEIDERVREERLQHIMEREKTLKRQRDRLMAKLHKSRQNKYKGSNSRGYQGREDKKETKPKKAAAPPPKQKVEENEEGKYQKETQQKEEKENDAQKHTEEE